MIDRKTTRLHPAGALGVLQVAEGWASFTSANYVVIVDRGGNGRDAGVTVVTTAEGKVYQVGVKPNAIRIGGTRVVAPKTTTQTPGVK